ncbi:MAG: hypothetical protein AB7H96_19865 [Vicinamibacterales bacterium]
MRLHLEDMLALAGRLTDQPGPDAARERFRRFLAAWRGTLDDLRTLIEDGQRSPDDQSQRALMDLVLTIGRYLGFTVSYGVYDRRTGSVRFDGAWRSPGRARIVLEVRTDRSRPFSPDDLARTIAALPDVEPPVAGEDTFGLSIAVPLHGRRRRSDGPAEATHGQGRDLPLHAVLMLAVRVQDGSLTHEHAVELLAGVETDARVAELLAVPAAPTAVPPTPHLSLVPREEPPDHWIATIPADDRSPAEQFVEAVVRGRRLLGVGTIGIFPGTARAGDWVCFYVAGRGVVGHGRLSAELDRSAVPLRSAEQYTAVFGLDDVDLYDQPRPLDQASPAQRLAERVPFDVRGPFLSSIPPAEFHALTSRPSPRPGSPTHAGR